MGAQLYYSPASSGPGGFQFPLNQPWTVTTDASGVATLPTFIAPWGVGTVTATLRYFDDQARAYVTATADLLVTNEQGGFTLSFQDLWWSGPLENGWGMSIVQHGDQLFNVLFVYDAAGNPTWYVQPGGQWYGLLMGQLFLSPVYSPRGSPWFAYDVTRFIPGSPVGQIQLDFRGPTEAYAATNVSDRSMYKHIAREDFSRTNPSPLQGIADMWWGGPQQDGWGMVILEQPGGLFVVWFTYDEAGMPTWFVMPGGDWTDAATPRRCSIRSTAARVSCTCNASRSKPRKYRAGPC